MIDNETNNSETTEKISEHQSEHQDVLSIIGDRELAINNSQELEAAVVDYANQVTHAEKEFQQGIDDDHAKSIDFLGSLFPATYQQSQEQASIPAERILTFLVGVGCLRDKQRMPAALLILNSLSVGSNLSVNNSIIRSMIKI